jgi:hypothetical protein
MKIADEFAGTTTSRDDHFTWVFRFVNFGGRYITGVRGVAGMRFLAVLEISAMAIKL